MDGLTSLGVLLGAAAVAAGWKLADPIVALVTAIAILAILRNAGRDVYRRLMDAVDPELLDDIEQTLLTVDGVEHVDQVLLRWVGHRLRAEVDLTVASNLSLIDAHDIAVIALTRNPGFRLRRSTSIRRYRTAPTTTLR